MFLILPSLAVFIAQEVMDLIPCGFLILLATLIFTPYLVSKVNKVEYKDDMFHSTSTKKVLCSHMPKNLGFVLWSTIPFTAFWILFLHNKQPNLDENLAVYNIIFWFVPTIYFILKNYPIAMIFNKTAWTKSDGTSASYNFSDNRRNNSHHFSSIHSSNKESLITSPRYRYLSCNIFNKR